MEQFTEKAEKLGKAIKVTEARKVAIGHDGVRLSDFINGGDPIEIGLNELAPVIEQIARGNYEDGVLKCEDFNLIISKEVNPAVWVRLAFALGNKD